MVVQPEILWFLDDVSRCQAEPKESQVTEKICGLSFPLRITRPEPENAMLEFMYGWTVEDQMGVHLVDNLSRDLATRMVVSLNITAGMTRDEVHNLGMMGCDGIRVEKVLSIKLEPKTEFDVIDKNSVPKAAILDDEGFRMIGGTD